MVKNLFLQVLVSISICMPTGTHAEQANSTYSQHIMQLKKAAALIGYGAVAATGASLITTGVGATIGFCTLDPQNKPHLKEAIQKEENPFKKIVLSAQHYATPQHKKLQDWDKKDIALLGLGTSLMAGIGSGMIWCGARGIKKTLYGQTEIEKQAEKEQNEKIKETVKETSKTAFDIAQRSARVTAYSIATMFGAVGFLLGVVHWTRAMIDHEKPTFLATFKYQWQSKPKNSIGYTVISPIGIGTLIAGIHGLMKEYHSWKESQARQNIVNVAQAVKEKVTNTVHDAQQVIAVQIHE